VGGFEDIYGERQQAVCGIHLKEIAGVIIPVNFLKT
jgi:hypothetical protein